MPVTRSQPLSLPELRGLVAGRVIGPGDEGYDAARGVVNGLFDRRPAAIVRVANAEDVVRVVGLARRTGLELAVRSGGHSPAGHSTTDGGIVLDLSALKAIEIDEKAGTAWVESGVVAGELARATAAHGMAVPLGDTGSVGIGGLTLSGGVGYLVRKHGLTIDSLLAAELVTADGRPPPWHARRARAHTH